MSVQHLSFKNFTSDNMQNTTTLLHESIPITGTLLSGTYATSSATSRGLNIKSYSHGMFQSVYDYPYMSSSANHIFDISTGFSTNAASVSSSATVQVSKKVNIYNQMAQVLAGYDTTSAVRRFDADGDFSDGAEKMDQVFFLNFSRLLIKDELKKGTFEIVLGTADAHATPMSVTKTITDSDGTNFRSNSPAGEYGFLKSTAQAASVKISFNNAPDAGKKITINTTDGSTAEFTVHATDTAGAASPPTFGRNGANNGADHLKTAIEANAAVKDKVTVSAVTTEGSNKVIFITQNTAGLAGNKAVPSDLNNVTVGTAAAGSAGAFTGGYDNVTEGLIYYQAGIAVLTSSVFGQTQQILNNVTSSWLDVVKKTSIDSFADGVRNRVKNISFNNTTELNSSIYSCKIGHNDFNYSSNPTYLKNSKIVVKTDAGVSNEKKLPPVSYITTVGLYSANNELMAVAKLSEPLRNDPTVTANLRVRLDF